MEEISLEDLIADEDMVVTITHEGYIKTTPLSVYRSQKRGGKGRTGITTKELDFVETLFTASKHNYVLFFTNLGRCYWKKVHEIPEAGPAARGKALVNLLNLTSGEKVAAVLPVREFKEGGYIMMATRKGIVKKTELHGLFQPARGRHHSAQYPRRRRAPRGPSHSGSDEILLTSYFGQAIRFKEDDVRDMGRTATGVIGIRLDEGDKVVSLEVIENPEAQILTVTEMGYGKRTLVSEYRVTAAAERASSRLRPPARTAGSSAPSR